MHKKKYKAVSVEDDKQMVREGLRPPPVYKHTRKEFYKGPKERKALKKAKSVSIFSNTLLI